MIDAVVFDLFGTLIRLRRDTHPYRKLCRTIGCSGALRESLVVDAPTLGDFCDHLGVAHPAGVADIQRELDFDIGSAVEFPDARSTLRSLRDRGLRIALVSNLASPYKRAVIQLDLDSQFDAIVYSCDIGFAKPDRNIYNAVLAKLGTPAESTLMVGDNQRSDVDGPRACGMRGLLVDRNGISSGGPCLRSLSEITAHLGS